MIQKIKKRRRKKTHHWDNLGRFNSRRLIYFTKTVYGRELEFCLIADTQVTGTTCIIKQVGVEEKVIDEVPVYEAICPEGSEEDIFAT